MQTILILMAMQYLNTPYLWGGNSYNGLDCSGFVLKSLHDSGLTLPDMTAQGLHDYCVKTNGVISESCDSLIFFGKSQNKITHVAISMGVIDGTWYMIEAAGAGKNSLVLSKKELAQKDARVRIKKVSSRRDKISTLTIKYKG